MAGRKYPASLAWAQVKRAGPHTEKWRGYHDEKGSPHPRAVEDPEMVWEWAREQYPVETDIFLAGFVDFSLAWACQQPPLTGLILFVTAPWCSKCRLVAGQLDAIPVRLP